MDSTIMFGGALALFCLRDARLVALRHRLFIASMAMSLAAAAGCGLVAERLSAQGADAWLRDERFWIPAALIHAALAIHALQSARSGKPARWVSLLPAPVWCVAIIGASRTGLAGTQELTGLAVGLALGAAYVCAVGVVAKICRETRNAAPAHRFASVSHLSAFLLVPAAAILDRPLAVHGVDSRTTAIVLCCVGAILAASFGWHRARS